MARFIWCDACNMRVIHPHTEHRDAVEKVILEGQRSILDRVRQLPSPVVFVDNEIGRSFYVCRWCHREWGIGRSERHESDCLYVLAHTLSTRPAEGQE